jgi:uncharacterized phage protein (TIGR01671 family)
MREIKFKVWSFGQKRWVEKQSSVIKFSCELNEVFDTKEYEFQQYTGLEDKNGKEIYEGDILELVNEANQASRICEVVFEYYSWRFKNDNDSKPFANPDRFKLEIIGNIFENPELLKK